MHSGSESEASVGCLSSHPKTTKPQICSPLHPPTSTSSSAFPLFLGRPGSLTCSARSLRGLFWVCSQCPRQTHVHSFSSLTHPVQTLRLCKYCFPRHLSPLHDQTVMCLPEPCAVGALKVKERSLIPFSSTVARCQDSSQQLRGGQALAPRLAVPPFLLLRPDQMDGAAHIHLCWVTPCQRQSQ